MTNHDKTPASTRTTRYTRPSARDTQGQPSHPTRGLFMASLTLSLAAALTACWSATPQPITSVTQTINEGFRVTNVQAFNTGVNSQGATGATGSSTGISINFDQAVNRVSVEQSVNIFEGEINHDSNPTPNQFTKLGLTSMCNGYWRVRNPNTVPISFTWDTFKTPENGAGVVQANTDTFFTSSLNAETIRVHVNNKQQQVKAKNPAACTSSPMTFAWAADSKSVVVSPKTALVLNKTYSVVVSTFAKNSSGSAALSVPFVSKVVVQENSSTSGTLMPGGSFTSRDGVVISDPGNQLESPAHVFAEPVNLTSLTDPIPTDVTPIKLYKVGANPVAAAKTGAFRLGFPLPQDAAEPDLNDYFVFGLVIDDEETSAQGKVVMYWESFYESRDISKKIVYARDGVLGDTLFMIAKVNRITQSALVSSELSATAGLSSIFRPNCDKLISYKVTCKAEVLDRIEALQSNEFAKLSSEMRISPRYLGSELQVVGRGKCKDGILAYYFENPSTTFICVDLNGDLVRPKDPLKPGIPIEKTIRHEFFHSIQYALIYSAGVVPSKVPGGFYAGREWIIEGTAEAASTSDASMMNIQSNRLAYNLGYSVLNEKDDSKAYRFQDFWVFTGRKLGEGIGYMRPIFATGLLRNVQDVQSALDSDLQANGMPRGLPDAYWEWAKNQGYESTVQIRNLPECKPVADLASKILPIRPDYPSPRSAQYEEAEQAASNLIKFDFTEPKSKTLDVQRTMTRVIPIRFTNPDTKPVKITLTSNSGPALNYKVYRGTVPASSTDCTNDPEGTFQQGTKAEILETVSNKTELVVFVANTDFVNPSSFTVTVEAVGKPGITVTPPAKLTTPIGPSISGNIIIENTGAIGSTLEYQVYQASQSSVDITSFNNRVVSTALSAKNGLRSAALPPRGFPSAPPADVWDGGSVSVFGGAGSLVQGVAPDQYLVTATCTKPGSHTTIVPIVYYTGEFDSRNVEQVAAADVRVEIECMATEEGMGLDRGFNYVDPVTGFKNVTTLDDPGCPGNDYDATIEFSRIISFFAANTYRFEQVFNRTFKCVLETDIRCFGCYSVAGGVQYGATERHVQIYSELYNAYTAWAYGKLDEMLASHSENHPEYKYFSPYVDFGKSPKICAGTTDYCYQPIKFVVFRVFR